MAIKKGDKISEIVLPQISGSEYSTKKLIGQNYMISFFRFASCPFCNLRIHQLVNQYSEFGIGFTIVALFDSPLHNLIKHTSKHQAVFPILADEENKYYKIFGIKKSVIGVLAGIIKRFPALMKSMFVYGNFPIEIKGSMLTMPADFLIDENGIVVEAYYGKDEGDHLPIEKVIEFSKQEPENK